jgi:hypothetical protein
VCCIKCRSHAKKEVPSLANGGAIRSVAAKIRARNTLRVRINATSESGPTYIQRTRLASQLVDI